jgi:hypothetical protein
VQQDCGLELTPDGSPCPCGLAVDPLPYGAQLDRRSRAAETCTSSDRSSEKVEGMISVCPPAL